MIKEKNNERKRKKIQRNIRMDSMKEEWAKINKNGDGISGGRVARNLEKGKEYILSEEKWYCTPPELLIKSQIV
jgi:hypothetical protein